MMRFTASATPWGSVAIVATARGLSQVILTKRKIAETKKLIRQLCPEAKHDTNLFPSLQRQMHNYFAGQRIHFRVKLDLESLTPFQRQVLEACSQIGYGKTLTYGQLARQIGRPLAARAVGGALARNPVPLVIPCHRVVAGNGSLGGFSAEQGIKLKKWLLELESKPAR